MAEVGITVKGLRENRQKLVQLRNFLKDGDAQVWDKIGGIAVDLVQKRTASGRDIKDQSFKPYSKAYAEKKGSHFVNLTVSGKMLDSIRKQSFRNKVRIYFLKRTRAGAKVSNYDLARIHQFGARAGRKHNAKIPQREFMGLSKSDLIKLAAKFRELFISKIKKITR
jgi:phage gpG-like protein